MVGSGPAHLSTIAAATVETFALSPTKFIYTSIFKNKFVTKNFKNLKIILR